MSPPLRIPTTRCQLFDSVGERGGICDQDSIAEIQRRNQAAVSVVQQRRSPQERGDALVDVEGGGEAAPFQLGEKDRVAVILLTVVVKA